MWSPKLDLVRRDYPGLAPLLERLVQYVQQQLGNHQTFIIPKLAGAAMKLTDGEAYALLETLAKANVLKRAYNVYCRREGVLLATVDREEKLDEIPYCDYCDCSHNADELKLEIAFTPKDADGDLTIAA